LKDLLTRTLTGISLVILVAGSILLGPVPFLLVIIMIYLLSARELMKLQEITAWKTFIPVSLSGTVLFLAVYLVLQHRLNPLWFILPAGIWLAGYVSGSRKFYLLALCWLTLPLTLFYVLGWLAEDATYRPLLPLSLIALVWVNDTFAYLTGTWIGKHRMTPRLSPGKTWEGFFGGLAFTLIGGGIIYAISAHYRLTEWLLLSLIIPVFGLWGDLFESRLKRDRNLKNTGNLLPGHGGILDRFDSLFFSAPAVFVVVVCYHYFFR